MDNRWGQISWCRTQSTSKGRTQCHKTPHARDFVDKRPYKLEHVGTILGITHIMPKELEKHTTCKYMGLCIL